MVVRPEPAASGDLAGVQPLLADSGLPTDVEGYLETFLVARHDGRLVGCVGMEVRGVDALFCSLAVETAYRGAGLGRRLYDALGACRRNPFRLIFAGSWTTSSGGSSRDRQS
jgi:N-acetylglutamate synthase-like GNAT family acetyltransferase